MHGLDRVLTGSARKAALGFRAHSGWAAMVAVAGSVRSPEVVERRRIELVDGRTPKQPFHAAEGLDLKRAGELIERCAATAVRLACQAMRDAADDLRAKGYCVAGCGILLGSGRPIPPLETTLSSHALIHAAEGEFFRDALRQSAEQCGLPVTGVKEREVYQRGAAELGVPAEELLLQVADLGRSLGPPWRQDEKLATLAAWLALAATSRRRAPL